MFWTRVSLDGSRYISCKTNRVVNTQVADQVQRFAQETRTLFVARMLGDEGRRPSRVDSLIPSFPL